MDKDTEKAVEEIEEEVVLEEEELDQSKQVEKTDANEERDGETPSDSKEAEGDEADGDGDKEGSSDDEEELEIEIEGETKPEEDKDPFKGKEAPQWVKDLRKKNREYEKKLKEYEKREAETPKAIQKPGPEPEMDDGDVDYDAKKFKAKWRKWDEQRKEYEKQEAEAKKQAQEEQEYWNSVLENHEEQKKSLKGQYTEEVEETISESLGVQKHGILVNVAENAALLKLALSRHPQVLEKLSKEKDLSKYTATLGRIEAKLKAPARKAKTKPEKVVNGAAKESGAADAQLERLRDKYAKTGDPKVMNQIREYRKKLSQAS